MKLYTVVHDDEDTINTLIGIFDTKEKAEAAALKNLSADILVSELNGIDFVKCKMTPARYKLEFQPHKTNDSILIGDNLLETDLKSTIIAYKEGRHPQAEIAWQQYYAELWESRVINGRLTGGCAVGIIRQSVTQYAYEEPT